MTNFSHKTHERFSQRGIIIGNGQHEPHITLTLIGMAWVFNYLHKTQATSRTITKKLLQEVANYEPANDDWRKFMVVASVFPAYEKQYLQLCFYLEGSPPKAFHEFTEWFSSVPPMIEILSQKRGFVQAKEGNTVMVKISPSETEKLNRHKVISFTLSEASHTSSLSDHA
ncbi:hypothetical protein FMZ60_08590 [Alcaligenaceae bacterium SJ-26]|nr:hypothetical protein FMZ60_08590 [Alcaligenaceae bacterium SJ-26]